RRHHHEDQPPADRHARRDQGGACRLRGEPGADAARDATRSARVADGFETMTRSQMNEELRRQSRSKQWEELYAPTRRPSTESRGAKLLPQRAAMAARRMLCFGAGLFALVVSTARAAAD